MAAASSAAWSGSTPSYSNVLSESVWYMFGGMVMLGGAWTLKMNEHVRVDLVYGAVSERTRTWIDLLGGLFFLMPLCILLIYFTWPWFVQAWTQNITSNAAGGLPRWPVRLMLPLGFGVLMLQGIAEIIKCILALTTNYHRVNSPTRSRCNDRSSSARTWRRSCSAASSSSSSSAIPAAFSLAAVGLFSGLAAIELGLIDAELLRQPDLPALSACSRTSCCWPSRSSPSWG